MQKMRESSRCRYMYSCNIKYQQYCSRSRSFWHVKNKTRTRRYPQQRLLPSWRGFALRPTSSLQKESWNSKWLLRDRKPLCVGKPATPTRARSTCVSQERPLETMIILELEKIKEPRIYSFIFTPNITIKSQTKVFVQFILKNLTYVQNLLGPK